MPALQAAPVPWTLETPGKRAMSEKMNRLGAAGIPFLFIIDFEMEYPIVIPLAEVDAAEIRYSINGIANFNGAVPGTDPATPLIMACHPISFSRYRTMFDKVIARQLNGDSYLLNLTYPTKIEINCSLEDVFTRSSARYRLWLKDRFVVFSPESFISIREREITSYPMKGTIDASIPGAVEIILRDEKEFSEHCTIVDLIRNDLNLVSTGVTVEKYRYIERIHSPLRDLYQVSSKIRGTLETGYHKRIGSLIASILPAGSVSGAPKKMTVDIIKEIEGYRRGYYTGVFGYFDGLQLDSGVMIRYIEKMGDEFFYKSGGGITVYSDPASEYRELLDKIYVPVV